MLQNFQKILHKWVIKAIVVLIILSFALWGVQVWFERGSQSTAIKVGKYTITWQNLRDQTKALADTWGSEAAPLVARQELIQQNLLKNLLDQTKSWLKTSDLVLLKTYPKLTELTSVALWPDSSQKARTLSIFNLAHKMRSSGFSLDSEKTRLAKALQQERHFDWLMLSANDVSKAASFSDAAIKTYYQQHASELTLPTKVQLHKLRITRKLWQQQLAQDERLKAIYQQELEKLEHAYRDQDIQQLSSTIKQAEINAQRRFAEMIVRELKYNPSDFKAIAESYGLTWRDLPLVSEAELPSISANQTGFDLKLLFTSPSASGWVLTTPLKLKNRIIVSEDELLDQSVVILWSEKTLTARPSNLAEAMPIIKAKLALEYGAAKLEATAKELAGRLAKGASIADYLLKYQLTLQKGRVNLTSENPSIAARLALSECAWLDPSSRAAWRCMGNKCYVVYLTRVTTKAKPIGEAAKREAKMLEALTESNWQTLEQQALTLPSDKASGVTAVEMR